MKFWKQHLTTKIAGSFLLLSLVTVGVVGGVTFIRARKALKTEAFERLDVAASLKKQEISRWFQAQLKDFNFIIDFPEIKDKFNLILNSNLSESEYKQVSQTIHNYLDNIKAVKPSIEEIYIINRSNKVIFSTNKNREGKYEVSANFTPIEKFGSGKSSVPSFYSSPETGKPAVTLSKTLRNAAGERLGTVVANLNLEQIDKIVRDSSGLGESGKTYLIGELRSGKTTFITEPQNNSQNQTQEVNSQGISEAMTGIRGRGEYLNPQGVMVLGEYRWLNDPEIALLVEINQQEAFAPARQLANTIISIGLVSVSVLLIGVYWLSLQLSIYRRQSESYSHQLEIKAKEAESANHSKSEFLANMSHELRTPLNAILGFAQLMKRDRMLSSEQRKSLATINRSGEHLLSLINDVLDMSKIEAGRSYLHAESFNLHLLLQTLKEMFQLRATVKGLFLNFVLEPNLPICIITDERKLRQVLINLLSNAIKFTEKGGVVLTVNSEQLTVNTEQLLNSNLSSPSTPSSPSTSSPPSSPSIPIHFEVKDTGKGIATDEIDKIFDPFIQTTSGVQTKGGTGLGLAISRQFVRLMGGDIYPTSVLGEGSSFSFDIKASLPQTPSEKCLPKKRVLKVAPSQPDYRILVVDDRLENRDLLKKLLTTVGFDTQTAANGKDAIATWEKWQPHLIWMDMRMSMMDGYEATRKIKAKSKNRQTVVIALTASAFEEQESDIYAAGCDDLVRKPFKEEVIFEKINQYLGVQYIYEEYNLDNNYRLQENISIDIAPQELDIMSPGWVASLHQAALEVDSDLVLQIIEDIPQQYFNLAKKLRKLTLDYNFDAILEISER
ncbi:MAG: histidine kinase dimerization/phospho-acceptor domain-containing protein [Cyanobacteria bacterium J06643_5]